MTQSFLMSKTKPWIVRLEIKSFGSMERPFATSINGIPRGLIIVVKRTHP